MHIFNHYWTTILNDFLQETGLVAQTKGHLSLQGIIYRTKEQVCLG